MQADSGAHLKARLVGKDAEQILHLSCSPGSGRANKSGAPFLVLIVVAVPECEGEQELDGKDEDNGLK